MNERIDELAFQSGITQHSFSDPKHPDEPEDEHD